MGLAEILGLSVEGEQIPKPGKSYKQASLLQFLSLGGDPSGLEVSKQEYKNLPRYERVKRGGRYFRVPGQQDLLAQATKFSQGQVDAKAAFRKQLQDIPEFAALASEAAGNINIADEAFRTLGQEVLGASAPRGFLFDQAPGLLAAVALEKAQFQRGIQERSRGELLGTLGLRGPQAFDPTMLTQPMNFQQTLGYQYGGDVQAATAYNDVLGLNAGINAQLFGGLAQAGGYYAGQKYAADKAASYAGGGG